METWKQFIGGKLVDGQSEPITVYNPTTGKTIIELPSASKEQAQEALEEAQKAFVTWSRKSLSEREQYIRKFIKILNKNREHVIDMLIEETGKPLDNAEYDFNMLPDCLDFFIEEAKRLDGNMIPDYSGKHLNMTIHKPIGVVVGYLAWNFPILNLGYKLGPILASGCTCVLKPSSQTPLTTLYIGQLAQQAGIPAGVINIIAGQGSSVSQVMNESKIPKMITLIGSSRTGQKIIEQSATSIKHYSLELGGNAPVIVMKDADVADAAFKTADVKFGNAGQVCVAPNRVFVHKDIAKDFIEQIKHYVNRISLGSGKDQADILMGPVISSNAQSNMQDLVDDAVAKGAVIVCGGKKANRDGFFFEPTVLYNVTSEMRVYKEEIFGPILPILTFDDADDPVTLANDTIYGLAAYCFTNDLKTTMRLAREIDSGSVCINEPFYNFNLPHGGCKESGVGKDCSKFSLEEYYYIQRIAIKL